jgi:glycosyltransferase involved in cell wall biosynthesis
MQESTEPASEALISVVISCYNQSRFLAEAIDSVRRQTWHNVELIVVDDGSTDDTALVAQQFPGIQYIHQTNKGLAAARNAGLYFCSGEYVTFLDADDRLLPNALQQGAQRLLANPQFAFVHGEFWRITEDGLPLRAYPAPRISQTGYVGLLQQNYIAMHGTVLYRKAILERTGGFDSSLAACEDYDMYLRIARTYQFGYHGHIVAEVRAHVSNMSDNAALMLKTSLGVLRSQRRFLAGSKELKRAFHMGKAFWRNWYGQRLVRSVLTRVRQGSLNSDTFCDAVTLARHYPRGIFDAFRVVQKSLLRNIRRVIGKLVGSSPPAHSRQIAVGSVRLGDLRRLSPVSGNFGFPRGTPLDRHYIEDFLSRNAEDIHGRVLEIGNNFYTLKFGKEKVRRSDVLNLVEQPGSTIIADLTRADHIPSDIFDCVILTQTLHLVYDFRSALRTVHRILKPGGVVLITVPGISQLCVDPARTWSDFWRFTDTSLQKIMEEAFSADMIVIKTYGNVLTATAFLQGLAVADLKHSEMNYHDPEYQLVISARAEKQKTS